jgi:hypothetical protein
MMTVHLLNVETVYVITVKNQHALMTVVFNLHTLIVEMASVIMAKKLLALMIAHDLRSVEMVSATMVRNPHAQMIVHLNALQAKSRMDMVVVSMIVLVYAVLHGMILNSAVCAPPNMWTMEMAIVFIITCTMGVVSQ